MKINLPNLITLLRIFLVPVFAVILFYTKSFPVLQWWAFGVFCIAAISDALDGYFARALKDQSFFGTVLDPVADKLLLLTGFIILSSQGLIPVWLTIIVVSRDVVIIGGVVIIHIMTHSVSIRPTPLGKLTTCVQMITLAIVLYPVFNFYYLFYLTAFVTIISGVDYVIQSSKVLNSTPHNT